MHKRICIMNYRRSWRWYWHNFEERFEIVGVKMEPLPHHLAGGGEKNKKGHRRCVKQMSI
jgi:hypothetical protein